MLVRVSWFRKVWALDLLENTYKSMRQIIARKLLKGALKQQSALHHANIIYACGGICLAAACSQVGFFSILEGL
jgi:hypothetical protein